MKIFLLFACAITLLTTTGCFFRGHRDHGWHDRGELIVPRGPEVRVKAPVVEVGAPEVIVR